MFDSIDIIMMTPLQFIALALRLFAIWLVHTACQIGLLVYTMRAEAPYGGETSYALAALYLATAVLLWKFPLVVARRLLPEPGRDTCTVPDSTGAVATAFVVAGLLIIALKALTPLANYLALLAMLILTGQFSGLKTAGSHLDGIVGTAMLAIGSVLILKCRSLAQRVLTRHTKGTP